MPANSKDAEWMGKGYSLLSPPYQGVRMMAPDGKSGLNNLYQEVPAPDFNFEDEGDGSKASIKASIESAAESGAKPKRKRRSKAEIEADRIAASGDSEAAGSGSDRPNDGGSDSQDDGHGADLEVQSAAAV